MASSYSISEDQMLFKRFREHGDIAARNRLVLKYEKLVKSIARRFTRLETDFEDFCQMGQIGLIRAMDLYDPTRGMQFNTYAAHFIEGEIRHSIRDTGRMIKIPAWAQEAWSRISKKRQELSIRLDAEITDDVFLKFYPEEEENLRLSDEYVYPIISIYSLDTPTTEDDGEDIADRLSKLGVEFESSIADDILLPAIEQLPLLQRSIVQCCFFQGYSNTEAAELFNISASHVGLLITKAVSRIRASILFRMLQVRHFRSMAGMSNDSDEDEIAKQLLAVAIKESKSRDADNDSQSSETAELERKMKRIRREIEATNREIGKISAVLANLEMAREICLSPLPSV